MKSLTWAKIGSVILVILAILIRLWVAPRYVHVDLLSNAGWGEWINNNGTINFYNNKEWTFSWPTQPPLVNLIYGWCIASSKDIIIWIYKFGFLLRKFGVDIRHYSEIVSTFDSIISPEIPFKFVNIFSIKLWPIIADGLIAGIILLLAKNYKLKYFFIYPIIFLLSPFSIYVSGYWGQYDSVSFLFLLLAFGSLGKYGWWSPLLFTLSMGIKPTSAIFLPFYIYLMFINRIQWKKYLVGGILAMIINLYFLKIFDYGNNLIDFIFNKLWKIIVNKTEFRVTTNSLNFWYIFYGDKPVNHDSLFLLAPHKYWGMLAIIITNLTAIKIFKIDKNKLFLSLFVVGMGSWLFGTNMLERYLYAGIVFGLIATIYQKWMCKFWPILSLLFLINLYKRWWQPEWMGIVRNVFENYWWFGRILIPVMLITIFIIITVKALKQK